LGITPGFLDASETLAGLALDKSERKTSAVRSNPGNVKKALKRFGSYVLVYLLSFGLIYGILNLPALSAQVKARFVASEEEVVLQDNTLDYASWISRYYFYVGNDNLIETGNDIDKDGLTNLDEYILRTNPTEDDSDGDEVSDGLEVINKTNPWGEGELSQSKQALLEEIDLIRVSNQISYYTIQTKNTASAESPKNFDVGQYGWLVIPRLSLTVPIVWTQDHTNLDDDLTKGAVHYPGTAMPGETGVMYISGHSSDYLWKNHPYKQIFAKINALQPGDDIMIESHDTSGKLMTHRYSVESKGVFKPDDQSQFYSTDSVLNLSTCWPIGSQKDRYVVSAELVSP
jgi:LPXTG-site transpeptidase (sortase) family protein